MKQKLTAKEEMLMNIFWEHGSMFISEREYRGTTISEVVARYYDNSYLSLVSQFVEEDKMDLQDLKDLIAQIEKNQK